MRLRITEEPTMTDTKDLAAEVAATLRTVGQEASGFVHGVTSSLDGAVGGNGREGRAPPRRRGGVGPPVAPRARDGTIVARSVRRRRLPWSTPMTERKPPGASWESWVDKLIRQGQERGEFDDLPGKGKPIAGLDGPPDPDWWIKAKLRREGVSYLPPTLQIRKDAEDALSLVGRAATEEAVRAILDDINVRIRNVNRLASEGPPSSLMPFDVDAVLARWRASRSDSASE
jgi:hypothetical protein